MQFAALEWCIALTIVILTVYYYSSLKLSYWRRKGVPGPKPMPIFGNFAGLIFGLTSIHETYADLYAKWRKYPFIGAYRGHAPMLVVNDLDLIKNILIKDFNVFSGRGIKVNEDVDPLQAHLFHLEGARWKYLRTKMTPIFTTGKIRHMFELMLKCADHFEAYLLNEVGNGRIIEFREVAAKFTTDVIGSCAFGINMNAFSGEDGDFRKVGRQLFESNHWIMMKRIMREVMPKLFGRLKIKMLTEETTEFFISSIRETVQYRQKEKITRNDLVDTLMEIQKKHDNREFELTEALLTAQAFVFFIAGFETSSTAISFTLYELAHAPEAQEKLISEVSETLKSSSGKLSYEMVNEMKYLDMVIQETLRKNPPGTTLLRQVYQPYTIPGTEVTLEPGTKVFIPIYGIQRDPEYFSDPEVFNPERFSEEAKRMRHPMTHLPFGDGPKNCIGGRFAVYQVKLGLIKVLMNYRVKPTKLTPSPYKIAKGSIILTSQHGVYLKLEPIL